MIEVSRGAVVISVYDEKKQFNKMGNKRSTPWAKSLLEDSELDA